MTTKPDDIRVEALRDALAATGMTQEQLAQVLGVGQPTVSHWLAGRRALTLSQAITLVSLRHGETRMADMPISPQAESQWRQLVQVGALTDEFC